MPIPQLLFFWNRSTNWAARARGEQQQDRRGGSWGEGEGGRRRRQHAPRDGPNHSPPTRTRPRPPLPPPLQVHLAAPASRGATWRSGIESPVSIGTGQKIQRILDEGNAIYLDVDPRDCDRILRLSSDSYGGGIAGHSSSSSSSSPPSSSSSSSHNNNDGGDGRGRRRGGKCSALRRFLLCGGGTRFLLDCAAKFVVVVGLYLGGHILMGALGTFLGIDPPPLPFTDD